MRTEHGQSLSITYEVGRLHLVKPCHVGNRGGWVWVGPNPGVGGSQSQGGWGIRGSQSRGVWGVRGSQSYGGCVGGPWGHSPGVWGGSVDPNPMVGGWGVRGVCLSVIEHCAQRTIVKYIVCTVLFRGRRNDQRYEQ